MAAADKSRHYKYRNKFIKLEKRGATPPGKAWDYSISFHNLQ
jgi:hypothetical protein